MIEVGEKAPDFSLEDQNGNRVALKDFRGQRVVLYFYPKDDTPGCTKQACGFRDIFSEFKAMNAVVLGVSPDGAQSHQTFIEKYDLPFTLLSDPDKSVMSQYGAWGEKVLYGKKSIGVIRSTTLIDEQGLVLKHWKKVPSAQKHPQKTLEILKEI